MKNNKLFSIALILFISNNIFAQSTSLRIDFTAAYYGQHTALDSILVKNISQGSDTTLYFPDTSLVLEYITGTNEHHLNESEVQIEAYPNPVVANECKIILSNKTREKLQVAVRDLLGREIAVIEGFFRAGQHEFAFTPGREKYYLISVLGKNSHQTIKIANLNNGRQKAKLSYIGQQKDYGFAFKSNALSAFFQFAMGDTLRYVGYGLNPDHIMGSDVLQSIPQENSIITFEIIEGIPCPGIEAVDYEGHLYPSVQIFEQCWLKEDLRVGTTIHGDSSMKDNGIIERYCYANDEKHCDVYGGLYQWDELMQYTTTEATQGICPLGWHVASNGEFETMQDSSMAHGYLADGLKESGTSHWLSPSLSSNFVGFTALPAGYKQSINGVFKMIQEGCDYYTSTSYEPNPEMVYYHSMYYASSWMGTGGVWKTHGDSVRCVKD
jgi:uncharacterized protein (TIGR02145 family)